MVFGLVVSEKVFDFLFEKVVFRELLFDLIVSSIVCMLGIDLSFFLIMFEVVFCVLRLVLSGRVCDMVSVFELLFLMKLVLRLFVVNLLLVKMSRVSMSMMVGNCSV